ncbi:MAG: FliI/YscN family ATPase [Phycisphaerales bacterium]|nr:FliI/YscN family ATPase [Phycisphaerales bacterium]
MSTLFDQLAGEVTEHVTERIRGRIAAVQAQTITVERFPAPVGARCAIDSARGGVLEAEVVALRGESALLSTYGEPNGVAPGDWVECLSGTPRVPVGMELLGRVIDARGNPLDGRRAPRLNLRMPLFANPPSPLSRRTIDKPLGLGIRAIDAMLTAGLGQRLGVFAGTGVGKSVLMGMVCRNTNADVNVVALVGERGREVRDFLETQLGEEGLKRSVVVACTSDEAAALRVRACFQATTIAEYFRSQGLNVLLMVDSITRMAMAQRQIGLAGGEPPTAKGYPPSVFSLLPRLLERAGRTAEGSITGVYTVLVEGGDVDEPLADAVRGILDGHIWLSRSLANRGHFPAIDVLQSISRVADDVVDTGHSLAVREVRRVLATWNDIEDLVSIGAYAPGANVEYDVAVRLHDAINAFLQQDRRQSAEFIETDRLLRQLGQAIVSTREQFAKGGG